MSPRELIIIAMLGAYNALSPDDQAAVAQSLVNSINCLEAANMVEAMRHENASGTRKPGKMG